MYGNKERRSCNQRVPMRYERDCDNYEYMMPKVKIIDECYNNRCDDRNYRDNGYSAPANFSQDRNFNNYSSADRERQQYNQGNRVSQPMSSKDMYFGQSNSCNNGNDYKEYNRDNRSYSTNQNVYVDSRRDVYGSQSNYGTRATEMSEYARYNQPPRQKAKPKMSTKTKVLIAVYVAIAILVTVLIIVNSLPSANAQGGSVDNQQKVQMVESATENVLDADGTVSNVVLVPSGNGYNYNTDTNWFDKFCDWVENLVG